MVGTNREAGRNHSSTPEEAFRTNGFPEFWEKFQDSSSITAENPAYEEIVGERFEAFSKLPEVIKAVKELAIEKNSELLGRQFTEEELAIVGQELERLIVEDQNFEVLDILSEQVSKYRELPKEIMRLKSNLANLGGRDVLEHQVEDINQQIIRREENIRQAEGSHEGMSWAKEGVRTVQDLEKGLELAEKVFLGDTEMVVDNYKRAFVQLESVTQNLRDVEQGSPPPPIILPDLSRFKFTLDNLDSKKTKPAEYLEQLAGLNFGNRIEGVQRDLRQAVESKIANLSKTQPKKGGHKPHPELAQFIAEFKSARDQVTAINIDSGWDEQVKGLSSDFVQVIGIRQGLGYLENDPTNRQMRVSVEGSIDNFQTSTGRQLGGRLKAGLIELSNIQQKIEDSPVSDDQIRAALDHSQKGLFRRLVSRDPEKTLRKTAESNTREVEVLSNTKEQILSRITSVEEADRQLVLAKDKFDFTKNELSRNLKSFEIIFKTAATQATNRINQYLESDSLAEVFKALPDINKLVGAREDSPELYGYIDTEDDDIDTSFYGNKNLRDLQKTFAEVLQVKIENAVKKALESLSGKELNPDNLAIKLKAFEDGLGSLAETPQYQEVRLKAFKEVTSSSSIFPASKKAVFGQMLREAKNLGYIRDGVLDLRAFVFAGANRLPAAS